MEKFINKINGNDTKLDLLTFLKIRKISVEKYLSENNISTIVLLETFLSQLEISDFSISEVFKFEAKQIIYTLNANNIKEKDADTESDAIKEENISKINKKKKSEINNDSSS